MHCCKADDQAAQSDTQEPKDKAKAEETPKATQPRVADSDPRSQSSLGIPATRRGVAGMTGGVSLSMGVVVGAIGTANPTGTTGISGPIGMG